MGAVQTSYTGLMRVRARVRFALVHLVLRVKSEIQRNGVVPLLVACCCGCSLSRLSSG